MNSQLLKTKMIPDLCSLETELKAICRTFGVSRLLTFGSVNTERFGPDSDIDVLVRFDRTDIFDLFDRYFGLKEKLEALFGRPVEIVFEKEFVNPYFQESVNMTKKVVYESGNQETSV